MSRMARRIAATAVAAAGIGVLACLVGHARREAARRDGASISRRSSTPGESRSETIDAGAARVAKASETDRGAASTSERRSAVAGFQQWLIRLRSRSSEELDRLVSDKTDPHRTSEGKELQELVALAKSQQEDLAGPFLQELVVEPDRRVRAFVFEFASFAIADPRAIPSFESTIEPIARERDLRSESNLAWDLGWSLEEQRVDPHHAWSLVVAAGWDRLIQDFLIQFFRFPPEQVQEILESAMRSDSDLERFGALEGLRYLVHRGKIQSEWFVARIVAVLEGHPDDHRALFLEALASVGGEAGATALRQFVEHHSDPGFRREAALTLELALPAERKLAQASEWIEASDPVLRSSGIAALGTVPGEDAASKLRELAKTCEPSELPEILDAMAGRTEDFRDVYRSALVSTDGAVAQQAVRGLLLADLAGAEPGVDAAAPDPSQSALADRMKDVAARSEDPETRRLALLDATLNAGAEGFALLQERMQQESDPTTRATAGFMLLLLERVRPESSAAVDELLANESDVLVGAELRSMRKRLADPDARAEWIAELERQKSVAALAGASIDARSAKNPLSVQARVVERMLRWIRGPESPATPAAR